jgi:hypothetical protein
LLEAAIAGCGASGTESAGDAPIVVQARDLAATYGLSPDDPILLSRPAA